METRGELISIGNDTRARFHKSKLIIFDSVIFGALGCYSKNWVHPSPGGKPWSSLPLLLCALSLALDRGSQSLLEPSSPLSTAPCKLTSRPLLFYYSWHNSLNSRKQHMTLLSEMVS